MVNIYDAIRTESFKRDLASNDYHLIFEKYGTHIRYSSSIGLESVTAKYCDNGPFLSQRSSNLSEDLVIIRPTLYDLSILLSDRNNIDRMSSNVNQYIMDNSEPYTNEDWSCASNTEHVPIYCYFITLLSMIALIKFEV